MVAVALHAGLADSAAADAHDVLLGGVHLDARLGVLFADGVRTVALLVFEPRGAADDARPAAAASAASAGKRSGQCVASNSKARRGRCEAVTESSSLMTAAPARTSAVQMAVSACFESMETFFTVTSPATAPATSSMAAALQSPRC